MRASCMEITTTLPCKKPPAVPNDQQFARGRWQPVVRQYCPNRTKLLFVGKGQA